MIGSTLLAVAMWGGAFEEHAVHQYRVTFEPVKNQPAGSDRAFDLTLLIGAATGDDAVRVLWLLHEPGRGALPWHERWGELVWSPKTKQVRGTAPSFEFDHASAATRIAIAPPLPAFDRELSATAAWTHDGIELETQPGEVFADRATWDVTARVLIGRRRTLTVDRATQQVYRLRENVFVGPGEEHQLKYDLVRSSTLDAPVAEKTWQAVAAWNDVRGARDTIAARLKELARLSDATPLAELSAVAARQLKTSDETAAAARAQREKIVGQDLPKFELRDVEGKHWSSSALAGKVTVLHVWTYRDDNLREPYGQVGYLDFLARKHTSDKVQVLGIAVAEKDAEEPPSKSAVRKFRDFMNVSYPLLLGDNDLLEKLGDPRTLGQELPLFVVIDAAGNIVEYRAGLYEVERNAGLVELEAVVKKTLAAK